MVYHRDALSALVVLLPLLKTNLKNDSSTKIKSNPMLAIPSRYQGRLNYQGDYSSATNIHWDYNNPDRDWKRIFPTCNGAFQSPIPLYTNKAKHLHDVPLDFHNYDESLIGPLKLRNNGHTVILEIPNAINGRRPSITGGFLNGTFEAQTLHFHWGAPGKYGSEHVIDRRKYDIEVHIVHKNALYKTMDVARHKKDGMAVLAIMMNTLNRPKFFYPGLNKILNRLPKLKDYNSTAFFSTLRLQQILGDLNTNRYFSYKGSLTTPTCGQSATWFVFPEPLFVSASQIRKFWIVRGEDNKRLYNNVRPLQSTNKRPVFYVTNKMKDSM